MGAYRLRFQGHTWQGAGRGREKRRKEREEGRRKEGERKRDDVADGGSSRGRKVLGKCPALNLSSKGHVHKRAEH